MEKLGQLVQQGRGVAKNGHPVPQGQVWPPARVVNPLLPRPVQLDLPHQVRRAIGSVGQAAVGQQGHNGKDGNHQSQKQAGDKF